MAHFAKLDSNNIVVFVVVGRDEDDESSISARTGDTYKKTSYNTRGGIHSQGRAPLRKNYAGIGYTYDEARDAFIPPKPFPSWSLNESSCLWEAPTPMPSDGEQYMWNEGTLSWVMI